MANDRVELEELRRLDALEAKAAGGAKPLPANAGLAKLGTSLLGLPVDTIENVLNLGLAGYGTLATALGRPDKAPELLRGSFGGSESLQRGLRATGEPGLSPDNPRPESDLGTAEYNFVARGGVLPGGALPAAGSMVAEALGGPEWAPVGAMIPSAVTATVNAARRPGIERQRVHNQVRDDTFADAQAAGYKVPPSDVRPTFIGNRVESVAGKAALNQQAVDQNQVITDNLARRAAGLPADAAITPQALEARRRVLGQPYAEVSRLSQLASGALQRLRDVRAESRLQWDHYERQRVPEAQRQAQAADQQAATLERVLEREAQRHGRPDLIPQLRQARQDIARTYDVERALNVGDGHVDAHAIARALDRGQPLQGDLSIIARFAKAFPRAATAEARNPTPGVSALEPNAAVGLGLAGNAGGAGWFPAGVPLLGAPARAGLLSDTFQRGFVRPNYEPMMMPEGTLQSLARTAILENEAARKK